MDFIAETVEIPQTAPNYSRFLYLYGAIKQMETIISTFEDK